MSSILTNSSAMVALQTLNMVNKGLNETQNRVSTGLQISSGKDNASFYTISENMRSDSGLASAVNDGLTFTKNSIATATVGAENFSTAADEFLKQVGFAATGSTDLAVVQGQLDDLVAQMTQAISGATFNGENLLNGDADDAGTGTSATRTFVSGISRATTGALEMTTLEFDEVDLVTIRDTLDAIDVTTSTDLAADAEAVALQVEAVNTAKSSLGVAEKSVENQQTFLTALTDTLDSGVSAMVDADMEEEAARLQAYQVQQQLATQSLSMANQAPQNILSLFR
ncbi:MAG: flagellin [Cognatishimia sp.]